MCVCVCVCVYVYVGWILGDESLECVKVGVQRLRKNNNECRDIIYRCINDVSVCCAIIFMICRIVKHLCNV